MGTEIDIIRCWMTVLIGHAREATRSRRAEERGDVVQTVILAAIFAAGAITIATILIVKFTNKARSVPTGG